MRTTTSLPAATYLATGVAYNGYLYEIGGSTGITIATVDYAPINSNGTLGSWAATTSLQAATLSAVSVAYNGYVYEIGTTSSTSTSEYAAINADGTLGAWTFSSNLGLLNDLASVIYNGYVYAIGGNYSPTAVVDFAPLNSIARVGHYSTLINVGVSNATLTSIAYAGTLPKGLGAISYETAGTSGVFGASALASSLSGSGSSCSAGSTKYVWLFFTLDDSQVGGFPDVSGSSNGNVTSFTINYTAASGHPPPNLRLRGGASFQSNTLQPLDTCFP